MGHCEDQLGWLAVIEGDRGLARDHFETAAAIGRRHPGGLEAQALSALAPLRVLAGEPAAGLALAGEAVERSASVRIRLVGVMTLVRAGETALLAADPGRAAAFLGAALRRLGDMGTERYLADCLDLVALVHVAREDADATGVMFAAADAVRARTCAPSGPRFLADEALTRRADLAGDPAVERTVRQATAGRELSADEAIALALAGLQEDA